MNERAKVVQQVGEAKRRLGYPVFAPHREREVLEKIKGLNQGPWPAEHCTRFGGK